MIYHYYMNDSENKLIPASTVLIIRDGKIGLEVFMVVRHHEIDFASGALVFPGGCLLYTSPSPRDRTRSRMPSSA